MNAMSRISLELNHLFDIFNAQYFDDQIIKPVIIAQTNGRDSHVMGWCTVNQVWKDKENQQYYEITVCAEYLNREIEDICATLLHEMVHLYNLQNGIKDTSRGNSYHNKRFKEEAEKRGQCISYSPKIGWNDTKLNDEARQLVADKTDATAFTLARARAADDGDTLAPKPKSSSRKYVCPVCGAIIRATKEVNVICGDCDVAFEPAC